MRAVHYEQKISYDLPYQSDNYDRSFALTCLYQQSNHWVKENVNHWHMTSQQVDL